MKIKDLLYFILLPCLLLVLPSRLQAGHLPIKSYTTFDGLPNDGVNKIVRDSRGFLWFCTGDGLSRFDGFEFKNYTQTQGLPHRNINGFLETKAGDLLIATSTGLAVFNPKGTAFRWNILTSTLEQNTADTPMFQTFYTPNADDVPFSKSILALAEAPDGRIFAGTAKGLFRLEKTAGAWTFNEAVAASEAAKLFSDDRVVGNLQFDAAGYLWLTTSTGINRISPEGTVVNLEKDRAEAISVDDLGRVWVGTNGKDGSLRRYRISADGQTAELEKTYRISDALPLERSIPAIMQTMDGKILVLTSQTLCEFLPEAADAEPKFRVIARGDFQALAQDGGGNLWLGTLQEGAWKISQNGFVKFDESDGITRGITSLFTNSSGELFITDRKKTISRFAKWHFESVVPEGGIDRRSWGMNQLDFEDPNGDWWVPSTMGLQVFAKPRAFNDLGKTPPKKVYSTADGLYGNEISNMFADSRGDVWISTINEKDTLQRIDQKTGRITRFSTADGLPRSNGAVAFCEAADGSVWIGFYLGGLARYRSGKFQFFTAEDGIPVGSVNSIYADKAGHLWIATAMRGVFRTDDPTSEKPHFVNLSTADGLSSNQTSCLTEDNAGQIYIGTGRGVNRLDPVNGNIKFYTQADGLPGSLVSLCRRDESGALWFVSRNKLVRFIPETENALKSPPVYIGGISVNGTAQKLSELGVETVENLNLASDERQIKIDFFALGFGAGERIQYQYKLDNGDWSKPDEQKSVTFNLASGEYRFSVRAVNADNVVSERPALFSFTIAPPFYRRWWFILLAALFVGGTILAIERTRAARLSELKNAFGKLSVSEQRFRQMIEQSSLGFVIFSPDGRLRSVNRAYENFWNVTFDEIKDWKMLDDAQLIESGVAGKLRRVFGGENISIPPVFYNTQKIGAGVAAPAPAEPRWIQSFAYPVKTDEGELLEVIMVMEDVTEAKNSETKLQNARAERLRELEQVRRRIAADLHDDIGSSLTQISIFSEVLQQRVDKTNERVLEPLEFIANSSRELIDAMSDIVWAINPQKDFLSELSGKMRRFASDVFTARRIELKYTASTTDDIALGANLRREVYLIFKESVNNIVKHSACTFVEIELTINPAPENAGLHLTLRDNGKGFEPADSVSGHGLVSMNARALGLGGRLEIVSGKTGTTVNLTVPLGAGAADENI
jgi:signal transduction histidine kinase/ligand-binding sensor domain-containing protein